MPPKKQKSAPLKTGTTIMGIEYDGGVVLAADSRITDGEVVSNPVANKLVKLSDYHHSCSSGTVSYAEQMSRIVRNNILMWGVSMGHPLPVQMVAMMYRNTISINRQINDTDVIVGGWDNELGGQVYYVNPAGMALRRAVFVSGSGADTVQAYLIGNYRKGMSLEEAIELATKATEFATLHDPFSGGVVRYAAIDKTGTVKESTVSFNNPSFQTASNMLWNLEFGTPQ